MTDPKAPARPAQGGRGGGGAGPWSGWCVGSGRGTQAGEPRLPEETNPRGEEQVRPQRTQPFRVDQRGHGGYPTPTATAAPSSSTSSATPRSRTSPARSAPACHSMEHIKRFTTIGTAHDQGKTSGVVAAGIAAELLGAGRWAARHHDLPPAVHAGRLRGAGRPGTWCAVRPRAHHAGARVAPGTAARYSRTSASGSGPGTTRCRARTWTTAVLRECRRGPRRRRHPRRLDPRQDRRPGPRRRRFLDQLYTNVMSTLKVGPVPLRPDVPRRRHGPRRRHRRAPRRRPLPVLHHHRRCGRGPRLDGGVAADRVARPAGVFISVTEHWATFAVVGPCPVTSSGAVFADVDVSAAMPFPSWPGGTPRSATCRHASSGSPSRASWPTRSTSTPGSARAVWERLHRRRRTLRDHAIRHRGHARPARREGLPDHRPGHRRHRHPA